MNNLNFFGDAVGGADAIIELDSQKLIKTAINKVKLDDFGDDNWCSKFQEKINELQSSNLHLTGRLYYITFFLIALRNRLLVTDRLKRCPAILDEKIDRPIIITGLPRTGTTYLFELLSQDERFHSPVAEEALCPIEPSDNIVKECIDRKTIIQTLQSIFLNHSQLKAMHYIHYNRPVECYSIMEAALNFQVPNVKSDSYEEWLQAIDAENNYKWHKVILSILQFKKPNKRWILKCPYHMNHLEQVFKKYPDAQVIHTHRNPIDSTISLLHASKKENELYTNDHITNRELQRLVIPLEGSQRKVIHQRKSGIIPEEHISDVYFDDLVQNPISTIENLYESLGIEFSAGFRNNLTTYISENPKNKHGNYSYTASDFDLSNQQILDRFQFYTDHYQIDVSPK